jgi:hypothetical protein
MTLYNLMFGSHIGSSSGWTRRGGLRGPLFRRGRLPLFPDRSVRPNHGQRLLSPESKEPLVEAGVLLGECFGASAVSLHDRLDQRAMLILLEQHKLPERFDASLRYRSRDDKRVGADELIGDLALEN